MKKNVLLLGLLFSCLLSLAQQVELDYQEKSLNSILIDLCERYELQYSLDDHYFSTFNVTVSQAFASPEKAFDFLLKDLPAAYKKLGSVYVFYEFHADPIPQSYVLSGGFYDHLSSESLPYTHLQINGTGLLSDQNGSFSFVGKDKHFHLQASYLGYFMLDTLVEAGGNHQFLMRPSNYQLQEVEVKGLKVVRSLQVGNKPGVLRLNHQVAQFLPGNGDNSVFNLLRLQPGILAAGEQSNDLVIWGSYEGQSQVLFDGFTLFGMKNFNDNISAVNPLMAKDIQVLKGAYGADQGGRVGGLVNITGVDGDRHRPHVKMSVNNMTLNGMLSVPVAQQAALTLAFRQTYYELYDSEQLTFRSGRSGNSRNISERTISPDYNFRDLNLKYSGITNNGDSYGISALLGEDRFSYSLDVESEQSQYDYEDHEHNRQYAVSGFFQKKWENGSRTKLSAAYSKLDKEVRTLRSIGRQSSGQGGQGRGSGTGGFDNVLNKNQTLWNAVAEAKVRLSHQKALAERHQLEWGAEWVFNPIQFQEDSFLVQLTNHQVEASRLNIYVQDAIAVTSGFDLKFGLRSNYSINLNKWYWQPRFSAGLALGKGFKLNLAAGRHNQFITRSSLVDGEGNYHYLWSVCNDGAVPVLDATHGVAGLSFHRNKLLVSLEAFRKNTNGLTRYVDQFAAPNLYEGESKTHGLDFFIKQEYKGHEAWISYTLSETLEHFDYFASTAFQRALHDQRHELKAALLLNFDPVHLSSSYVFGSGFPDPRLAVDGLSEQNYNRLDLAATYRWAAPTFSLEAGISILNVLNHSNLKYANFIVLPEEQDVSLNLHAEAIPFTPTVFLNLSF
ncbi:TonB-dependent receptor plug domain-containing protein [Sunxiuqinia rutila]|uniref:TonB-dependent receptor plug domain-containing protein n=1 Tax=Sunxiuqinia rutila TaxID=1397841 RepID=UPI003D367ADA